nr:ATP synthase F0 subunit 6 [Amblyseius tsugawai]
MMMLNLFMIFDPSTNILQFNWISLTLPLILTHKNFWWNSSRKNTLFNKLNKFILIDMKNNMNLTSQKSLLVFLTFFSFIYLSNLMSLLPFIFTPTSHMSLSLFMSSPFWISLMLKGWLKNYNQMLTHLIPKSTPLFLCPFMVIIETISNFIRPLTLAIRLSANMIAGHILISLLSNTLDKNFSLIFYNSLILDILLILEISVSMIQGYVFIVLMSLYLNEISFYLKDK